MPVTAKQTYHINETMRATNEYGREFCMEYDSRPDLNATGGTREDALANLRTVIEGRCKDIIIDLDRTTVSSSRTVNICEPITNVSYTE